jgi:hypothetical protein
LERELAKGTPWDDLQGQVLLGESCGKLKDLLEAKKQVIRPQRYVDRQALIKYWANKRKAQRNRDQDSYSSWICLEKCRLLADSLFYGQQGDREAATNKKWYFKTCGKAAGKTGKKHRHS